MVRYGYCCINLSMVNVLGKSAPTTNRTMIRKTFDQKGLAGASSLALQNCKDILPILKWNLKNGIYLFRLSSSVFPWASEYKISDLNDYGQIKLALSEAGDFAKENGIRITSHPGPFNKLCSGEEKVVLNTIRDLEIHGETFDMMGFDRNHWSKINIHIGGAYGDKPVAISRFVDNFFRLPKSVSSRLTVENDDKESLYSTRELVEVLYSKTGIPIVHDQHHHGFCDGGLTQKEAMLIAAETWPKGLRQVIHYSESRSIEASDPKIKPQAHSDFISSEIETFGMPVDVMIESKMKDLSLLKYLSIYNQCNNQQ